MTSSINSVSVNTKHKSNMPTSPTTRSRSVPSPYHIVGIRTHAHKPGYVYASVVDADGNLCVNATLDYCAKWIENELLHPTPKTGAPVSNEVELGGGGVCSLPAKDVLAEKSVVRKGVYYRTFEDGQHMSEGFGSLVCESNTEPKVGGVYPLEVSWSANLIMIRVTKIDTQARPGTVSVSGEVVDAAESAA